MATPSLSLNTLGGGSLIKSAPLNSGGPSLLHDFGQLAGHAVNALPGYSTLGSNITNPNTNFRGAANPRVVATPTQTNPDAIPIRKSGSVLLTNDITTPTTTNSGVSTDEYNQAIANLQKQYDLQPAAYSSALTGVNSSYDNALNQLLLNKNRGQTDYNQSKQNTATDYVNAKNTIGSQAGETLNSLLRLLGSRGAGGSSAVGVARSAVGRGASIQRGDVGTQFGQNNQSLDNNWNNYLTDYGNQVSSAGAQRDQQKQSLLQNQQQNQASIQQQIATLQEQLAAAQGGNVAAAGQASLDNANSLLSQLANYTVNPINYTTKAYTPPSVASYTVNPNASLQNDASAAGSDYFSPYLQSLLGKKQLVGA